VERSSINYLARELPLQSSTSCCFLTELTLAERSSKDSLHSTKKHGIDEVPIETIDLSLNPRDFELLARKHNVVFHLSAVFGGREFVDIHQVECSKMLAIDHNVISSSYEAGIQHLHYASSACVYAPSLNRPDVLLREDHILSTGEGWQSSDNLYGFAKSMGEMS
jgi:nucleoside-diphosphate-sugar epimerase